MRLRKVLGTANDMWNLLAHQQMLVNCVVVLYAVQATM